MQRYTHVQVRNKKTAIILLKFLRQPPAIATHAKKVPITVADGVGIDFSLIKYASFLVVFKLFSYFCHIKFDMHTFPIYNTGVMPFIQIDLFTIIRIH